MDSFTTNTTTYNTSVNEDVAISQINYFYAGLIPILSFFTIIGNLLIITAFWKLPSLREKPSELLILNLSCIDLITGSVVLPFWAPVYITPGQWPFGEIGCKLAIIPVNITIHASLYTLIAISIDRFLLILVEYPKYMKMQSLNRVRATIAGCWTFAMLIWIVEVAMWDYAKTLDYSAANINFDKSCLSPPRRVKAYSLSIFLILYFTPVMTVCGLSITFLLLLIKRLNKNKGMMSMASSTSGTAASDNNKVLSTASSASKTTFSRRRYTKPAISLCILVLAMILCMLPYCFYVMIIELFCEQCNTLVVIYAVFLLQFCNACLDPFLYGMAQKKIRRFYLSAFRNSVRPI